ncbi:alpha/beta fold hydrolase [Deinococcus detaillensis]|uniref:Alpha/beta fold hydrolase n=1 Tax=Deinococcus detaillensis TaxID=2592048 RepID=A0A553UIR3_9DEIO|nr:alpha/beta fold hydrolase [Deinococcus detaillensis]TSA80100.1 alpha/beta fold hydrolase [Deinococcus detaillensis]
MSDTLRAAKLESGKEPGEWVFSAQATFAGVDVPLRLGAQSWGTLNPARDNAVLVCHYYTGTMRAAGLNPDGTPGWWAALIGPGLALDTDRFFVICMNTLSNVQAHDLSIVTTGPDTAHPDGQIWGPRFPAWDFGDLHAAQLGLMRALGAPRWHAVVGPSLGGLQALQWAAITPELAPRVMAVATSPQIGPALRDAFTPFLRQVAQAGSPDEALRLITFFGLGADGMELMFRDGNFGSYLSSRSGTASLPHILDLARLIETHNLAAVAPSSELFARWAGSGLRLLTVNIAVDQFFPAAEMRAFAQASAGAGVNHTHMEFASSQGHLGCVNGTAAFAVQLQALLNTPVTPLPCVSAAEYLQQL